MRKAVRYQDLLRIRLARRGHRNRPLYEIRVMKNGVRRDGKCIESLGMYDPFPDAKDGMKHIHMNFDRIKYWLAHGATPSDRVAWLLGKADILPSIPRGPTVKDDI